MIEEALDLDDAVASVAPPPAEPLFFGPGARLAGFFHAPARAARAAVVLVDPFGHEAICVHRAYRRLAERLAVTGFAALRFDLDGTGDSRGDDRDPGRVAAWIASIGHAVDELRARSGAADVVLFGVRLGALLALACAAERGGIAGLALVAPCASGRAYARELFALRRMTEAAEGKTEPRGRSAGDEEAAGFLLTEATLADLARLDAASLDPRGARVLVIPRDDVPSGEARLVAKLSTRCTAESRDAPGYRAMMAEPHKSIVPGPAFDAVLDWLGAAYPRLPSALAPSPPSIVRARPATNAREPAEELVRFGADHRLFGLIASPSARASDLGVVLLNAGAIHRIGPSRLHVALARELAADGFASLRLDLGGLGDSRPAPGTPDNGLYSGDAASEASSAMSAFAERAGVSRFVLAGLCSGAYVAFHGALEDARVAGAIMINPQTFTWGEGDRVGDSRSKVYGDVQSYRRSLLRVESWSKMLRGDVDLERVARTVARRAAIIAENRLRRLWTSARGSAADDEVRTAFAILDRRGVRTLVIMSEDDTGLDYLATHLGSAMRKRTERYRMEIIEGADHTFTPLWSQDALRAKILSFVREVRAA